MPRPTFLDWRLLRRAMQARRNRVIGNVSAEPASESGWAVDSGRMRASRGPDRKFGSGLGSTTAGLRAGRAGPLRAAALRVTESRLAPAGASRGLPPRDAGRGLRVAAGVSESRPGSSSRLSLKPAPAAAGRRGRRLQVAASPEVAQQHRRGSAGTAAPTSAGRGRPASRGASLSIAQAGAGGAPRSRSRERGAPVAISPLCKSISPP